MVIQITNVIVFSILYAKFWCMYVKMEMQVVKYKLLVLENYIVSLHMHKKNLNKYCCYRFAILT
jgi:hypothetical protein